MCNSVCARAHYVTCESVCDHVHCVCDCENYVWYMICVCDSERERENRTSKKRRYRDEVL